jgi:PAS domain S-box-containing protein
MQGNKENRRTSILVHQGATPLGDLEVVLVDQGYRLRRVPDARSAIEAFQREGADLVLVSCSSSPAEVEAICQHLIAEHGAAPLPVLAVAMSTEDDVAPLLGAGAADYLRAPFGQEEVAARLELHRERARLQAQLKAAQQRLENAASARWEAEQALQEAEQSGQSLVANLSEVIYTADAQGLVTYISPTVERLLGFDPEEVLGQHVSRFIHGADPAELRSRMEQVLTGQRLSSEYQMVTRSQEVRWVRTSSQPVFSDGKVAGFQGVLTDITDRKEAEERIRQQNDFLTSVLESLTHPFYVVDAQDYRVVMANSAARIDPEASGTTCYALTHRRSSPCDVDEYPCPLREIKQTKKPATVEHIHFDADGNPRYHEVYGYPLFDDQGNVTQVIEYSLDVTERTEAEAALHRSEALLRETQRMAQVGGWELDLVNSKLTWTEEVNRIHEVAPDFEPTLESALGFYHPDDRRVLEEAVERATESGQPWDLELRLVTARGQELWVRAIGRAERQDGQVVKLSGTFQDITERRRADEALREAIRAAEAARREEGQRRREAEQRRQVAESLAGVLAALNSSQPLEEVLDHIVSQARQLLGSRAAVIYTPEKTVAHGLAEFQATDPEWRWGQAIVQAAIASGQAIAIPDLASPLPPGLEWVAGEETAPSLSTWGHPYQALLAVPIQVKARALGGMLLYYAEPQKFDAEQVELATIFGDQVALAVENERLRAQAEEAAAAAERSRLARELHDSVTQALFSASLVAEVLPGVWRRDPDEGEQGLEELRILTRSALAEMRTLLLELRPTALVEGKLDELLWQLAEATTGRTQLVPIFAIEPVPKLPPEVQVAFYRVAQEALNNVVKHAHAQQVRVQLDSSLRPPDGGSDHWRGQLTLSVSDDGCGLDEERVSPDQLGLTIMRERAESIGAALRITPRPERGTDVRLIWPSQ